VTHILQIYSYILMYIPPVCTQSDHYLWWDQNHLVVTRDRHRKGACKKGTQIGIKRITTDARESIFFVEAFLERIKLPTSLYELWHGFLSLCLFSVALSSKLIRSWVTQQNLGRKYGAFSPLKAWSINFFRDYSVGIC